MIDFPEMLKHKRKKLGMSQGQLAEAIQVHPQTISKWERGLHIPHPGHASAILLLLDNLTSPLDKRFDRGGRPARKKGKKRHGK